MQSREVVANQIDLIERPALPCWRSVRATVSFSLAEDRRSAAPARRRRSDLRPDGHRQPSRKPTTGHTRYLGPLGHQPERPANLSLIGQVQ
jgi:hypothetical protein